MYDEGVGNEKVFLGMQQKLKDKGIDIANGSLKWQI